MRGTEWNIVSKGIGKDVPSLTDEEQMRGFWRQWQTDVVGTDEVAMSGAEQS